MNAPTWLPEAIDEIAKLRALPHNWDSYGADPPSAENCLAALCLMRLLPEAGKPRIVPFDSGMQLEWGDVEIAFSGEITAIDAENQDAEWAGLSAEYIKAAVAWLRKRLGLGVSLVEQAVLNPPSGMAGWRNYRIEYPNGMEGLIWLPPGVDREQIESLFPESEGMALECPRINDLNLIDRKGQAAKTR